MIKIIIDWLKSFWAKSKKTIWLILAFLCVLSIGYFTGCNRLKKERALSVANLTAYRDTIQRYSVKIVGLEIFISVKNAIIEDQKDAIRAGLLEKERLKALHLKEIIANTKLESTIKILRDSLKLVPGTTIITVKDTSGVYHSYVKIPFDLLKIKEKYLILNAGMDTNKLAWFDLETPFSGELSIGYQKAGFLKVKPVGIFTTENPYLKVNSMDALIIKENKKIYQKTWFHVALTTVILVTGHQLFK
jgi:hypothetical protein